MIPEAPDTNQTLTIALLGGCLYVAGIFLWAFTTGIQFSTRSLESIAFGFGYTSLGMFLIAAVPLYLLGRLSLISPVLFVVWSLGTTVYFRWYVAQPHDVLASYLPIWPFDFGLICIAAIVEVAVRIGAERAIGRFGLRSLF